MGMNRISRRSHMLATMLVALLLLAAPMAEAANPNPGVLPPHSEAFGKTYAEWSVRWWRWLLSQPSDSNPTFDTSGIDCANEQSGPVWFLAGTPGTPETPPVTRACDVPVGKAVLFPIINYENDFPCPDPTFKPDPGQSLRDFLTNGTASIAGARDVVDGVTFLQVTVDGVPLTSLFDYRATSDLFRFTGDPSLTATFDACITGSSQPAVSDGFWIMLTSLPPGSHTIHFKAAFTAGPFKGFTQDVTYVLTVKHAPHQHEDGRDDKRHDNGNDKN